jgi:hypothetical protein
VVQNTRGDEHPDLLDAISSLSDTAELHFPAAPAPLVTRTRSSTVQVPDVWLNPLQYMRISLPPSDIVAYLGRESTSLAGSLFWSMLEHSQIRCSSHHDPATVNLHRALSHSKAIQDIDTSFVQAMISARVEYKHMGFISPKYAPAAEQDLSLVIHQRVELDYRETGKNPDQFISCLGIQKHLSGVVGRPGFDMLEQAARNEGRAGLIKAMNTAKCKLYDTAICFGDGPRWDIRIVNGIFLDVLGSLVRHTFSSST